MSRMIALTMLGLLATNLIHAADVDKYPPGQKPFHSPKAPVPNGVLAPDVCFGFHATQWRPWNYACSNGIGTSGVGQSCTNNKAIIIFEEPSAVKNSPSTLAPAPESTKPMPPAKR